MYRFQLNVIMDKIQYSTDTILSSRRKVIFATVQTLQKTQSVKTNSWDDSCGNEFH